jgi:hypothetical protein
MILQRRSVQDLDRVGGVDQFAVAAIAAKEK